MLTTASLVNCINACRGNPCLCGGVPSGLGNVYTSLPAGAPGTVLQPCNTDTTDTICGAGLWADEYRRDTQALLTLKANAAEPSTLQRLAATWRASVPPCTNSSTNGSCVLCDEAAPLSQCGTVRASDGVLLCNWRFVECRDRRVIKIDMAFKVGLQRS